MAAPKRVIWRTARLAARYRSPAFAALTLVGALALLAVVVNLPLTGGDAISYWHIDLANPYEGAVGNLTAPIAFRYSPPIALLFAPLGVLDWFTFRLLWLVVALVALAFVTRRWVLATVAVYPVLLELAVGNVHLLLAAALVAGLRWPAAWAAMPLFKVTPVVTWVWFIVRGEWRSLALAMATTTVLVLLSAVIAPHLWPQWLHALTSGIGAPTGLSIPVPLAVRLPVAVALVAWGARTDRAWVLPLGLLLSIPTIWPQAFAVLVALPAMIRQRNPASTPGDVVHLPERTTPIGSA